MIWIIGSFIPRLFSVVITVYGITLPPFVFIRHEPSPRTVVHEEIHGKQTADTVFLVWPAFTLLAAALGSVPLAIVAPVLAILFHLIVIYGGMWLLGCVVLLAKGVPIRKVGSLAYRMSPLEREAYDNELNDDWKDGVRRAGVTYLARRQSFAWVGLIAGAWDLESPEGSWR